MTTNTKNSVYALGNALLDYEYRISEELLAQTNIPKATAALVLEEEKQQQVFDFLQSNKVDLIKKSGGGSSANSMYAMASLGANVAFSGCVNDDADGQFFLQELSDSGVNTSPLSMINSKHNTGSCVILITPDAERTMNAYLGATEDFSFSNIDEQALIDSDYVYVEGYLCDIDDAVDASVKAMQIAKANNKKCVFNFADPSIVYNRKDSLTTILEQGVDISFCNLEEATGYTETKSAEEASAKIHQYAETVVITLGREGVFISERNGESFIVPAPKVENVVDTNGAGDNFAGAFMFGITQGYSLEKSAQLAVTVAGKLVSMFGPRLQKQDYIDILQQFKN